MLPRLVQSDFTYVLLRSVEVASYLCLHYALV